MAVEVVPRVPASETKSATSWGATYLRLGVMVLRRIEFLDYSFPGVRVITKEKAKEEKGFVGGGGLLGRRRRRRRRYGRRGR